MPLPWRRRGAFNFHKSSTGVTAGKDSSAVSISPVRPASILNRNGSIGPAGSCGDFNINSPGPWRDSFVRFQSLTVSNFAEAIKRRCSMEDEKSVGQAGGARMHVKNNGKGKGRRKRKRLPMLQLFARVAVDREYSVSLTRKMLALEIRSTPDPYFHVIIRNVRVGRS